LERDGTRDPWPQIRFFTAAERAEMLRVTPRLERDGTRDRRHRIRFFTVAETAEMLRVCTRTVRRWIAAGKLVAHRFDNAVRIAESDLRAFLALHREG
jgi:excisionase family DNA binding protein